MSYTYFAIVGQNDHPIFEDWFDPKYADGVETQESEDLRYLHQFLVHKAVDAVAEQQWSKPDMYLKAVDDFNEYEVSSFVTPSQVKLMLLHDRQISNNDGIKNFFNSVHEIYIKSLLNPFYVPGTPLKSAQFRIKIRAFARRYL
eukprot:m.23258 g.23258  ORF g.23258 m.23258 type:complete len:144 (+) comp7479_c0_seq2:239-670(+)